MEPCPQGIQNVLSTSVLFFNSFMLDRKRFCFLLFGVWFFGFFVGGGPAPRQLPNHGLNPGPAQQENRVLTIGPPKEFPGRGSEKLVTFLTHSLKNV